MVYTKAFSSPEVFFGDLFELTVEEAAHTLWDGLWNSEQATVELIQQALKDAILNKELVPVRGTVIPIGSYNANPAVLDAFKVAEWAESRGLELESNGAFDSYVGDEAELCSLLRDHLEYLRRRKELGETESTALEERLSAFTEEERYEEFLRLEHENAALRDQLKQDRCAPAPSQRVHGNSEHFSRTREQVVGAAFAVLAEYPEQCRNSKGKVEATKIRKLIEEKAPLFWPKTGEPPLQTDSIERLIRKYLNPGNTGE